ncbi:AtfA [Arthroderma uncinatum]|uniref:AtfA n=1 Tax=Arthroderma uncinatum TaxID=74035 RepID=UPI00144A7B13|nr:AtfA [Arthroderma uncinatum]KAF3491429.1 AtfA [Arthroderma uncinatum]
MSSEFFHLRSFFLCSLKSLHRHPSSSPSSSFNEQRAHRNNHILRPELTGSCLYFTYCPLWEPLATRTLLFPFVPCDREDSRDRHRAPSRCCPTSSPPQRSRLAPDSHYTMSAPASKAASPQAGLPASRTDSPMDGNDSTKAEGGIRSEDRGAANQTESTEAAATTGASVDASQAIASPPKPGQAADDANGDYFSGIHNTSHLSFEPNPFEQSFGNPTSDTPGKSLLPPVASLTSPALPGTSTTGGFNWTNSLRAGPLSPAMLAGPAGSNDYFDGITRGFPTPNESSLRTGLTPGGGGSMFPSPGPSALLQQMASGNATPTTLDFQRTALNAARKNGAPPPPPTSNPQEQDSILQQVAVSMDIPKSAPQSYPFAHADATDAANGLFMLAKGAQATSNPFPGPTSQPMQMPLRNGEAHGPPMNGVSSQTNGQNGAAPPSNGNSSDGPETSKINTRSKGKRGVAAKGGAANGRRKAEDIPKASNKRQKAANGAAADKQHLTDDDSVDLDNLDNFENGELDAAITGASGTSKKNMTDEEKKKNFKERNRVAALKCRQRKKQWVATLIRKAEAFSSDNEALSGLLDKAREENAMLRSMLAAHKDCPIGQSQGLSIILNGMQVQIPNNVPNGMPNNGQNGMQNSMQNGIQDILPPQNWQMRR